MFQPFAAVPYVFIPWKKKLQSVALPKKSSTMSTTGFGGQFLRHPGSGKVTMLETRVGLDSAVAQEIMGQQIGVRNPLPKGSMYHGIFTNMNTIKIQPHVDKYTSPIGSYGLYNCSIIPDHYWSQNTGFFVIRDPNWGRTSTVKVYLVLDPGLEWPPFVLGSINSLYWGVYSSHLQ